MALPLYLRAGALTLLIAASTPADRPSDTSALTTPADSIADRLKSQLTPWLDARSKSGAFSGVVLIARNGTPIYSAAYGMADRERGIPNTLDTRFNLGSASKMWTAIAIGQLVEAGKVDLDAPVGKYLPELSNKDVSEKVLVRHLLTHTSGLGTYFQNGFLRNKTYVNSPLEILPFFINDTLEFEPGSRMSYSNAGFAMLGMIVERASGMSYYDYMQKNILDRAGMKRSAFLDLRNRPADIAVGYAQPPGAPKAESNWEFIEQRSSPAGGAYASARDLVTFSRALWSGKLLSPALVKEFTGGKVDMGPGMKYAFGFGTGVIGGWRHVGHNGGIPGANAEFMAFPDQGIDVIVLANMDPPAATDVWQQVIRILTGVTLRMAPPDKP